MKARKVKPEIWNQLNPNKTKVDLQLSNMKQVVHKVTFATLQITNVFLQNASGSANSNLIMQSIDVVALLGHVNTVGSVSKRRDQACFKAGILYHLQC